MITFATTYALILPAITVERNQTDEIGGMYLEQEADRDDMLLDYALEPAGEDILAGKADEEARAGEDETDAEIPDYDDFDESPTDPAEADDEAAPAVNTLKASGNDYTVTLTYDETSGIPEEAYLTASEITEDSEEYQTYLNETKKAMGLAEEETLPRFAARFFDIKIMVGEEEIRPESGVSVEITYAEPLAENPDTEVSAVHFADETAEPEVLEASTTEVSDGGDVTVEFTAESFSVYGVVYTVDFHWEVDGKTYDFSIPGGGYVTLRQIVEVLGIAGSDAYSDNVAASGEGISKLSRRFVADVKSVEFSDPSLVWVGKIDESSTVGALKEAYELECQYSAELTEEDIAEINNSVVEAGDWALIGLEPFASVESMTLTMNNGEVLTLMVTDARIDYTANITDGNNYYIYTVSNGIAYALSYDGSTSVVDINNPSLGDDYNWKFTKHDNYWIIQNAGHSEYYLDLKGGQIASTSASGISIVDRTDLNAGFSVMNWDNSGWVYLTLNGSTYPYTYTTTFAPSGSRMRLLDAPVVEIEDPEEEPVEKPTSQIPNTIEAPTGTKTLVPNVSDGQEDGTYTLSLSVTPHSNPEGGETTKKANVLIVMDRSSSMITRTVSNDMTTWYYGHTDTATFRGDIRSGTGNTFYDANGVRLYENAYWAGGNWGNYTLHYGNSYGPQYSGDLYVTSKTTRLKAEQDALSNAVDGLLKTLLDNNEESGDRQDVVEIKVISFGDQRFDKKSYKDETESDWVNGKDTTELDAAVGSSRYTSGTNWEEALQYAWSEISKKKAEDGNKEEYYVVFLTDGEPTAIEGNELNSAPYSNGDDPNNGYIVAYDAAKDEAATLVNNGIIFYNIFTFRTTEKIKYSIYLTNYAYGNGDRNEDATTDAAVNYFSDAKRVDQLKDKFNEIISSINTAVGHTNVVISDMLTTDALTSTTVDGKAEGFMYTVMDHNGIVVYTVTSEENPEDPTRPIVTFHVPNFETGGTDNYPATRVEDNEEVYYTAEIDENTTYKMALAKFTDTDGSRTGKIEWDLSSLGMLLGGYTYTVSFVVWPDQDAYDYVAALNNKIPTITNSRDELVKVKWDESTQETIYEEDGTTIKYYKYGVQNYPSIVKYPDGTFAVLTNTEQKIRYSVIKTETIDGVPQEPVISDPLEIELPTPEPMPLTATGSKITKIWQVNRDPEILLQLLYEFNTDGTIAIDNEGNPIPKAVFAHDEDGKLILDEDDNPVKLADGFFVDFIIKQDGSNYKTVRLGWDDDEGKYVWYEPDETDADEVEKFTKTITYGEGEDAITVKVGTKWEEDFSIATGLMLTYDRVVAIGLNPDDYVSDEFEGTTYYVLEYGHDFTISEPELGYEYDFLAPTYHPMLVNGVMKSVLYSVTKDDNGKIQSISISEIEDLEIDQSGKLSLEIANSLRGYINLNKVIVERDGTTPDKADLTEFECTIELFNESAPFTVEGSHIPWYGISGLFYHDGDGNYYQAYAVRDENGDPTAQLTLTDENNVTYSAACVDRPYFDEDIYGPTKVRILIDESTGKTRDIDLYGNQMTPDEETAVAAGEYKRVTAIITINQNQTLSIANVPLNTDYTITESTRRGYELIEIDRTIMNGDTVDSHETLEDISEATIDGTIVTDRDNNISYTNRKLPDLEIIKVDSETFDEETKHYLKNAEFTVTQLDEEGTGQYKQAEDEESGESGDGEESGAGDQLGASEEPGEPGAGDQPGASEEPGEPGTGDPPEETEPKFYYQKVVKSDDDGRVLITDLEPGYYEIKETKSPAGYVVTAKPIYIKLINGVITRISKTEDDPETTEVNEGQVRNWPSMSNTNTELIHFTPGSIAVADDPDTAEDESRPATSDSFLIGNELGAALPHTGGMGTTLFYLMGLLLVGAAGVVLVMRRRSMP